MPVPSFPGLTPEILGALDVPGVAERWAAVQQRLHPALAALAEQLREAAARRLPRQWPLYEISYRALRYTNRGDGSRAPIEDYHMAIDRPPRGAGVYLAVSAAERLVVVALQLNSSRKEHLRQVWEEQRGIWLPLVQGLGEVRFADARPRRDHRTKTTPPPAPLAQDDDVRRSSGAGGQATWLDRYLANRGASYLLAGYAYAWDDERVARPEFAERLIEDILALLPLNEAIMEQAEALDPAGALLLREQRARYSALSIPPADTIVERVRARGLTLPDRLIRAYHVALQTKPLAILPGISGTGKTRLTRLYADAVYDIPPGQENHHYLLVAVQPDWHNARDLLGYHNAITGRFHATPFLRFLERAAADPAMPYYVCLDELNLARPEYYLAPLLSALETEDHLVDLGAPGPTVETVTGEVLHRHGQRRREHPHPLGQAAGPRQRHRADRRGSGGVPRLLPRPAGRRRLAYHRRGPRDRRPRRAALRLPHPQRDAALPGAGARRAHSAAGARPADQAEGAAEAARRG
jgi:hypothetical protein